MTINLIPMTQTRLHHSTSAFNLSQEPLNIDMKIFVYLADVNGENGAEEQPTKARCRVNWQIHVP
jgi:hypothetical protein